MEFNRCPYCFKPLPESGECDCHYEESDNARIMEALQPGTVIGACYLIGGVLGKGGFGITYKGFDLDLDKEVAIKEFYPKGMVARASLVSQLNYVPSSEVSKVLALNSKDADVYSKSLEMFYKEARVLAKLNSYSNVVHVYRIFRENNTAYFVMDYVQGKALSKIIHEKPGEKFSESELIPLLDPILAVLAKIHKDGILHRDIAPDNILIDEDGNPVLLDFGAAKDAAARIEKKDDDIGSVSSVVVEKKGFTPLEQIGGHATARSDIYALGATYYYLLSGKLPPESYMRAQNDDVVPLTKYGVSKRVSDAVLKAFAFHEEDRWPDVASFREALNAAETETGTETETDGDTGSGNGSGGSSDESGTGNTGGGSGDTGYGSGSGGSSDESGTGNTGGGSGDTGSGNGSGGSSNEGGGSGSTGGGGKKTLWMIIAVLAVLLAVCVFFIFRNRPAKTAMDRLPVMTDTAAPTDTPEGAVTDTPLPTDTNIPLPTDTDTPVPTETNTPLPTDTNTPVPTDTNTPAVTETLKPTRRARMQTTPAVSTDTNTPVPTDTNTPLPTSTDTPVPTDTDTPVPTDTDTPVPTDTNTPIPTDTDTPVPTDIDTPVPTDTNTPLPTSTDTPVPTDTDTPVPTDTDTPVPTDTNTPLPTATDTPVPTDTATPLPTATDTPVPTDTPTPVPTNTRTPTPAPVTVEIGLGTSYYTIDDMWRGLPSNSGSVRVLLDKIERLDESQIILVPEDKGITELILDSEKPHTVQAFNVRLYANGIPLRIGKNLTLSGMTVFGGGYAIGNTEKALSSSDVVIYGTVYDVYAGGEIRGAGVNQGRASVETANLEIYGNVVHNVYGGGYAVGTGSVSHVEESYIFLDRRALVSDMLYYGGFVGALCQYGSDSAGSADSCQQEYGTVTMGTVYADIRGNVNNGIHRSSNGLSVHGQADRNRYYPSFSYEETEASMQQKEASDPVYQEIVIGYGKDFDRISTALQNANIDSSVTDLTIKVDNYYNYTEAYAIVVPYLGNSLERVTIDADIPVSINMANLPIYANGVELTIGKNITLNNSTIYAGVLSAGGTDKKDTASLVIAGEVGMVYAGSYVSCMNCVSEITESTVVITGTVRNHVFGGGYVVATSAKSEIGTTTLVISDTAKIGGNLVMGGSADYKCAKNQIKGDETCSKPGSSVVKQVNAAVYAVITGDVIEDGLAANNAGSVVENLNYIQAPDEGMMHVEYPQVIQAGVWNGHKTLKHAAQSIMYPGGDVTIQLADNVTLTDDFLLPTNKGITSVRIESVPGRNYSIKLNEHALYANGVPLTIGENVTVTGGSVFAGGRVFSGNETVRDAYLVVEGNVSSVYGGSSSNGVGTRNAPCRITTENSTLIIKGTVQNNVFSGGYSIGAGSKSFSTGVSKVILANTAEVRGNLYFGGNSQSEIDTDLQSYCSSRKNSQQCSEENVQISTTVEMTEASLYGTVWGDVVRDGQSAREKSRALLRAYRFAETDPELMGVGETQEITVDPYQPVKTLAKAFQKIAYTDAGTDVVIYLAGNQEIDDDLEVPYDKNLRSLRIEPSNPAQVRSLNFKGHYLAAGGVPLTIGKNIITVNCTGIYAGKLVKNETGGNATDANRISVTAETAKLTILGRVQFVYGGGKAVGDAAESLVGSSEIEIEGLVENAVFGGGSAVNSGHTAVGDVRIHIAPEAAVNQNIYCGGHAEITQDKGLSPEMMYCYSSLDACMQENSEANCRSGNDVSTGRTCVFRVTDKNRHLMSRSEVGSVSLSIEGKLPEPVEDHIHDSGIQGMGGVLSVGPVSYQ